MIGVSIDWSRKAVTTTDFFVLCVANKHLYVYYELVVGIVLHSTRYEVSFSSF